jgi:hypothetical protein
MNTTAGADNMTVYIFGVLITVSGVPLGAVVKLAKFRAELAFGAGMAQAAYLDAHVAGAVTRGAMIDVMV